jgi:hypothetical protein
MMLQDRVARLCDVVPGMTRAPALLFIALWDARGATLSYDRLAERACGSSADSATDEALRTSIKRVRQMISAHGLPLKIEVLFAVGYRMTRLDPAWTWE